MFNVDGLIFNIKFTSFKLVDITQDSDLSK